MGIDGPVDADAAGLADAVTAALRDRGTPVAHASRRAFLRPRSIRLEHGDDPQAPWERWYDDAGLRRELLDPLGLGGSMAVACSLWDAETDRATREPRRIVPAGTVGVVHGPFLLRPELADCFDLTVHLHTSAPAVVRRVSWLAASWQRYLDEADPAALATLVVRNDDPRHPALVVA